MPEDTQKEFPKDFMWGASISGYQTEGGNHSQWTEWEQRHAPELAKSAEARLKHLSVWPEIKKEATKQSNYVNGRGVDHYNRYKKDFELLKQLNLNAFRFGVEWSRIEPKEGQWDQKEIQHYKDYIHELRKRGIEPVMNVWHWSMPTWFTAKGAFKHRRNLKYFYRFVQLVADELCGEVTYVLILNEPNVYSTYGYLAPEPVTNVHWPPEEKSVISFAKVFLNLVKAHKHSYYILKHAKPSLQVGMAQHLANIQAKRPHNLFDEEITQWMRYFWNWWFLRRTRMEQDFIGFNYYFSDYYRFKLPVKPEDPKTPASDMGWYMEPEGIYPLLLRVWAHYKKPIIITENGVADMHDEYRRWWLEETIVAIERATSEGVKVIGYFYWSLLDNFEWSYGFWPRFGLVKVDRAKGLRRTIRPSAKWFAQRIKKLS